MFALAELVVIQGTSFCNIDCQYCYLPDRTNKARMTLETLRLALEGLRDAHAISRRVSLLWHSGEPLVLGTEYMRNAFTLSKAILSDCDVQHIVQTNGTLLNDEWIDLFCEFKADVGLSCDGPPDLHDRRRVNRRGLGTSGAVYRAARRLKAAGMQLSVICVLGAEALRCPPRIFDYFESLEVDRVAFNIEEVEGVNVASSAQGVSIDALASFLANYFSLAISSGSNQRIRELSNGIRMLLLQGEPRYSYEQRPFRIITVATNGDVSCLSPELLTATHPHLGRMVFANVHTRGWVDELRSSTRLQSVVEDVIRGNELCQRTCSYFVSCGGGVPSNKLAENATFRSTETLACRFYVKAALQATAMCLKRPGNDWNIPPADI
jgi:uncharacterized protein